MQHTPTLFTAKDLQSDQEVRWCPGCGDYSILKQVQTVMPELGLNKHEIVFVSGIGCSSRFPYYMNTYGIHSIHGRATAIATGLKITNPKLSVWVITGDGDALSIGGNHFIHLLRRNVNVNVLLFNNEIYGLTKGQYSPTSEIGTVTKSTPYGSLDSPFNPLALALGAGATFIARSLDKDPVHLRTMLKETHSHEGTSLLEIYQNCNVFNDGAFDVYTDKASKIHNTIFLEHGKPLVYANSTKGIKLNGHIPEIVDINETVNLNDLMIHDETDKYKAQIIVNFFENNLSNTTAFPRPFGVIFKKKAQIYNEAVHKQQELITEKLTKGNLDTLLKGKYTWDVK
jgi:2-oxoglutarate ferredoxin oxidoreductase subunit beta